MARQECDYYSSWKAISGTTLPTTFNELLIEILTSSADRTSYLFYIPVEMLDSTYKVFRNGLYQNSSTFQDVYLQINKTKINGYGLRINGSLASSTLTAYYR